MNHKVVTLFIGSFIRMQLDYFQQIYLTLLLHLNRLFVKIFVKIFVEI